MPSFRRHGWWAALLAAALLAGCGSPYRDPRVRAMDAPPDFSVELLVDGPLRAADPRVRGGRFLVEPDRTLRAAQGEPAVDRTFPPRWRRLSPDEFQTLANLAEQAGLMAHPTTPRAQAALAGDTTIIPLYQVTLTAWGRTWRYATTPEASPPTLALLETLLRLRGIPVPEHPLPPAPTLGSTPAPGSVSP